MSNQSDKPLHCNNIICQSRELCKFGTAHKWNERIMYGQGNSANECQDFEPKDLSVIDDLLEDSGGMW